MRHGQRQAHWPTIGAGLIVVLALTLAQGGAGEVLYNGIELPAEWPPQIAKLTR